VGRGLGIMLIRRMVSFPFPPEGRIEGRKVRWWLTKLVGGIAQCPVDECGGTRAYFYMVQIRSADEPMTTFYKVCFLPPPLSFLDGIDRWDGAVCFLRPQVEGKLSYRVAAPVHAILRPLFV